MRHPESDSSLVQERNSLDTKAHRRPRFELPVEHDVKTVLERVQTAIDSSSTVRGMVLETGRIELTRAESKIRFWSPQLTIDVVEQESGALLRARFGPHPHIWTLYMALYSSSIAFALGCAMYGISQWIVGSNPWALFLIPASMVLSGLVYGASYVGQGLGTLQMLELRSFIETTVGCTAAPPDS